MMAQKINSREAGHRPGYDSLKMAALMMSCCVAVIAVFALIPVVGWPVGLVLGAAAIAAIGFAHQRLMGHGPHH